VGHSPSTTPRMPCTLPAGRQRGPTRPPLGRVVPCPGRRGEAARAPRSCLTVVPQLSQDDRGRVGSGAVHTTHLGHRFDGIQAVHWELHGGLRAGVLGSQPGRAPVATAPSQPSTPCRNNLDGGRATFLRNARVPWLRRRRSPHCQ
jgi:hypothetical protein